MDTTILGIHLTILVMDMVVDIMEVGVTHLTAGAGVDTHIGVDGTILITHRMDGVVDTTMVHLDEEDTVIIADTIQALQVEETLDIAQAVVQVLVQDMIEVTLLVAEESVQVTRLLNVPV